MGDTRVEAQTDGGLFIEVRNPHSDAADDRLVWPRHYYVLPLEVNPQVWCAVLCFPFAFLCCGFTFPPDLPHPRPNGKHASRAKAAPRKKSRLWILETLFLRRKSLQRCSEWQINPSIFSMSLSKRYCALHDRA